MAALTRAWHSTTPDRARDWSQLVLFFNHSQDVFRGTRANFKSSDCTVLKFSGGDNSQFQFVHFFLEKDNFNIYNVFAMIGGFKTSRCFSLGKISKSLLVTSHKEVRVGEQQY